MKKKRNYFQKKISILLATFLIFQIIGVMFLPSIKHVNAATQNWPLTTSGNYTYNSSKIEVSSGQASLKETSTPSWYDTNWNYRKPITIDNTGSTSTLTDYQVKIELNSGNFNYSNASSTGADIRLTDSNGTTTIDFWIEEWNIVSTSTIWAKVPSIDASSAKTIYMYYGNSSATSTSSISQTALIGDDFIESMNGTQVKTRLKLIMDKSLSVFEQDFASHGGTGQIGTDTDNVRSQEVASFYAYMYELDGSSTTLDHSVDIINWAIDNVQSVDGAFLENGSNSFARTAFFTEAMMFSYRMLEPYLDTATKTKWLDSAKSALDWIVAQPHPNVANQVMAEMLAHYLYYLASNDTTYRDYAYSHETSIISGYWTQETGSTGYFDEISGFDSVYTLVHFYLLAYYRHWSGRTTFDTYLQWMWNKERTKIDFETYELDTAGNSRITGRQKPRLASLEELYGVITDPQYDVREIARRSIIQGWEIDLYDNGYIDSKGFDWTAAQMMKDFIGAEYYLFNQSPDITINIGASENPAAWKIVGSDTFTSFKSSGKLYIETALTPSDILTIYSTASTTQNDIAMEGSLSVTTNVDNNAVQLLMHVQDNTVNWTSSTFYYAAYSQYIASDSIGKRVSGTPTTLVGPRARTISMNTPYRFTFERSGNTLRLKDDTADWINTTDATYSSGNIGFGIYEGGFDLDFVFVRKLASSDPSTSVGTEYAFSFATDNPTIQPTSGNSLTFTSLSGFAETATKDSGEIKYEISNDSGTTWYWYNSGWATTTGIYSEANTATEINSNINSFPSGDGDFLWKAFLHSSGTQLVQLDNIEATYISNSAPSATFDNDFSTWESGNVTTNYNLIDSQADVINISQATSSGIEYSLDGSNWFDATDAGGTSEGLTGLTSTSTPGIDHVFVWDSLNDASSTEDSTVYLRIRPNDGIDDALSWATSSAFGVDNVAPSSVGTTTFGTITSSSITVNKPSTVTENGSGLYQWQVRRNSSNELGLNSTSTTSITDSSLSENTQYTYDVQFIDNKSNTSNYGTSTTKYTLADDPTNVSASSIGTDRVTLSADSFPNDSSGLSGYYFYRSGKNSGWIQTNSWLDTGLLCGSSYSYNAKYRNGEGVETNPTSLSVTLLACSGSAIPTIALTPPSPPAPTELNPMGGFKITINNNDQITTNRNVILRLDGGTEVVNMAISNTPDFKGAIQEPYKTTKVWTLSQGNGNKTVYVKYYTSWGQPSESVSDSIILTERTTNGVPVSSPQQLLNNLIAQVTMLQSQLKEIQNNGKTIEQQNQKQLVFRYGMDIGSTGKIVKHLQQFLNDNGFKLSEKGPGSPGNETEYFGRLTKNAIERFQMYYNIVSDKNDPGYGYVGPKTRAKLNGLISATR